MIAQIKVVANAKEIEIAQKQYQAIAQENAAIEAQNRELAKTKRQELKPMPPIPEAEFTNSDLMLDNTRIRLAFVNSNGEISIKYEGDNFNLIYTDLVWGKIKDLPQFI